MMMKRPTDSVLQHGMLTCLAVTLSLSEAPGTFCRSSVVVEDFQLATGDLRHEHTHPCKLTCLFAGAAVWRAQPVHATHICC